MLMTGNGMILHACTLTAIVANSHNVRQGEFASKPPPLRHSAKLQPPTFGLWLGTDCCYSVVASGCAGGNSVGVTKTLRMVAITLDPSCL